MGLRVAISAVWQPAERYCDVAQNYQTDWEAILSRSPDQFISALSSWLYPARARSQSAAIGTAGGSGDGAAVGVADSTAEGGRPPWTLEGMPKVKEVLPSARARLEALNGSDAPRI